jgi:hypothetical protein
MRATVSVMALVVFACLAPGRCLADDKDEIIKLLKEVQQLKDQVNTLKAQVNSLKEENEKLRQAAKHKPPADKEPGNKLQKAIVGEWKNFSETETYTFDARGQYTHKVAGSFGGSNRGKYRFNKDGQVELIPTEGSFLGTAGVRVWRVELEGDNKLIVEQRAPIMLRPFELQRQTKK